MTREQQQNAADLSAAIRAVKIALEKVEIIGARNDGVLCSSLVGIHPALSEVLRDFARARTAFNERVGNTASPDDEDGPDVAVPDHEIQHEDGRREFVQPRLGLRHGRGGA